MKKYGKILFWLAVLILFNAAVFAIYRSKTVGNVSHVVFADQTKLNIWIAKSAPSKEQGLMFIKNMPENQGMLFVYENDRILNFWMRNTFIPLDMIFVWADMEIKHIHTWAKPLDESLVSSQVPVRYVIETNSGFTTTHNIKTGSKVQFITYLADIDVNLWSWRNQGSGKIN